MPLVIAIAMPGACPSRCSSWPSARRSARRWRAGCRQLNPTLQARRAARPFVANEESKAGVPFVHLFREGRAGSTLLLWVVNFMNIPMLYSLSNWLPTVVTRHGLLHADGGARGHRAAGGRHDRHVRPRVADRAARLHPDADGRPSRWPRSASRSSASRASRWRCSTVIVFVAGWCVVGGQPGLNALSGTYYPTYLRSTGVGAGLGVGRTGAIVGPLRRRRAAGAAVVVAAALLGGRAAGHRSPRSPSRRWVRWSGARWAAAPLTAGPRRPRDSRLRTHVSP